MSEPLPNRRAELPEFDLSSDQRGIRDAAERFFMDRLAPLSARMDEEDWWSEDVFPELGRMGYLGVTVPGEYGGQDLDILTAGAICEVMSMANFAVSLSWCAHDNLCANNLYRNGSEELRRRYLPALCDGTTIGALGLTEPGAGSDALGSMKTTARKDGNRYILNGTKLYITNGSVADVLLVYAKTDASRGAKGISAFMVEKDFPGFQVAQKLDKMGFRGSPTAELVFDDCEVPAANLVGEENGGVAVVMSGLDLERAMVATVSLGMAQRALDLALAYARERRQFGQPIAAFQMIQAKLAEMYIHVETARTFVYRALAACEGMAVGGGGRGEIHKLTAAAIYYASHIACRVADEAVQVFGGAGYMRDMEINRIYRAVKLLEIGAGTQEVRKIIISGEMLK